MFQIEILPGQAPSPISVGPWRAIDFAHMSYFHRAFMDEIAEAGGADLLQFCMNHTRNSYRMAVPEQLGKESG